MASTVTSRAETLLIRCEICDKRFKNSRSLKKHGLSRHECRPEILKLEENDGREIEDDQPKPQPIQSEADMRQFIEWMAYFAEKIMSCLSPKITGKFK